MAKFTNVSPLGALEVPELRRTVEPGEEFEISDDLLEAFEGQTENFERVLTDDERKAADKAEAKRERDAAAAAKAAEDAAAQAAEGSTD